MCVHVRDAGKDRVSRALVLCAAAELREKLADWLGEAGFAVDIPDTGGRAARLLKQSSYRALVTDRYATGWPGLGDLPGLKRRYDRMRIVVVANRAISGDRGAHALVGVDAVVGRPLTQAQILEAVLALNESQALDLPVTRSSIRAQRKPGDPRTRPIQSILAATDLTDRSDQALQRAALLARQLGATVDVLHVIEPGLPRRVSDRRAKEALAVITQQLKLLMPASSAWGGICIRIGDPSWEIPRVASERESYIVVLGPHGKGRFEHQVLETTGARVLRHCTQPVLFANTQVNGCWRRVVVGLGPTAAGSLATVVASRIAPGVETVFVSAENLSSRLHRQDFQPVATARDGSRHMLPLPRTHGGSAPALPVDGPDDLLDALRAAAHDVYADILAIDLPSPRAIVTNGPGPAHMRLLALNSVDVLVVPVLRDTQ